MAMLLEVPGLFEFYVQPQDEYLIDQYATQKPVTIIMQHLHMKIMNATKHKVYILYAGTGTGKSTVFAVTLFHDTVGKCVWITQPRVNLCQNKMTDIPKYYKDLIPGKTLGYSVGNDKSREFLPSNKLHNLLFLTTEKLTNFLLDHINKGQEITTLKYIAIDEAHEISEQMIFVVLVIKQFIQVFGNNTPLFIFMSATLNVDSFLHYFDIVPQYYDVGIIKNFATKKFKNELFEPKDYGCSENVKVLSERLKSCVLFLWKLYVERGISSKPQTSTGKVPIKDILIICTTVKVIERLQEVITQNPPPFKHKVITYGQPQVRDRECEEHKIFVDELYPDVKIIFSTVIMEAGETINSLYCIVDTGLKFQPVVFPLSHQQNMVTYPVSMSSKTQRIGRVGRVGDGISCLLYSNELVFDKDDPSNVIVTKDVLKMMRNLIKLQLGKYKLYSLLFNPPVVYIQQYDLIQNIGADLLNYGLFQLRKLGVIDVNHRLTQLGVYACYYGWDFLQILSITLGANPYQTAIASAIIDGQTIKRKEDKERIMDAFMLNKFYLLKEMESETFEHLLEDIKNQFINYYLTQRYDKEKEFQYTTYKQVLKNIFVL